MSGAAIFTRRVMGMDYRVWLVMPAMWVLSLVLLGYKYINDKPCAPAIISIDDKAAEPIAICYVNQSVKFGIQMEGITNARWNFKDGGNEGLVVYHTFTKEREYKIVATVNGTCKYEQRVLVVSRNDRYNLEKAEFQIFSYPVKKEYFAGDIISFESEQINIVATSYNWKVLETSQTQSGAVATFAFNKDGKYTIQLTLNNDPLKVKTKKIAISAVPLTVPVPSNDPIPPIGGPIVAPPERLIPPDDKPHGTKGITDSTKDPRGASTGTAPANATAREVNEEAFKGLLQSVVNEEKELEDLYEFLDYKGSTMVEVNGDKNGAIALKAFCKEMQGKKKNKRKIESLHFIKDNKNSIFRIQVKVPEKAWWWPF